MGVLSFPNWRTAWAATVAAGPHGAETRTAGKPVRRT